VSVPGERIDTARAQAAAIGQRRAGLPAADGLREDRAAGAYAGLVTRTIAFALDAAIINATAALVAVTVGLGMSILHLPEGVEVAIAAILAALWIVWIISYFVFFWSSTGQTPGDRVMRIRVIDDRGRGPLRPVRALVRVGGLFLAALPLFAGLLMMLWDERSRCLQDRLARTHVIYTPAPDTAWGGDRTVSLV
jgi:uncharacterized RDD family membrane protein YckC